MEVVEKRVVEVEVEVETPPCSHPMPLPRRQPARGGWRRSSRKSPGTAT